MFITSEPLRVAVFTCIAMLAFAGNSLLCRMALTDAALDPASFTIIRLVSGALTLAIIYSVKNGINLTGGSWTAATALFIYAAGFSFAYTGMNTGTGALLLFGAVQLTMIGFSLANKERFNIVQTIGFVVALSGLIILLLPSAISPAIVPSLLMLSAGVAWAVYTLMGRKSAKPLRVTTGNFWRALPLLIILLWWLPEDSVSSITSAGLMYAVLSGALASGAGYALWYSVLPHLQSSVAATIQLSVPVIAMLMGWVFLDELITAQMLIAGLATLGGIALVIRYK